MWCIRLFLINAVLLLTASSRVSGYRTKSSSFIEEFASGPKIEREAPLQRRSTSLGWFDVRTNDEMSSAVMSAQGSTISRERQGIPHNPTRHHGHLWRRSAAAQEYSDQANQEIFNAVGSAASIAGAQGHLDENIHTFHPMVPGAPWQTENGSRTKPRRSHPWQHLSGSFDTKFHNRSQGRDAAKADVSFGRSSAKASNRFGNALVPHRSDGHNERHRLQQRAPLNGYNSQENQAANRALQDAASKSQTGRNRSQGSNQGRRLFRRVPIDVYDDQENQAAYNALQNSAKEHKVSESRLSSKPSVSSARSRGRVQRPRKPSNLRGPPKRRSQATQAT